LADMNQLARIVHEASNRLDVRDAVAGIHAVVQREVDARRPLCVMSGRCCHFEEFGHRLYVTTIELAAFIHELSGRPRDDGRGENPQPHRTHSLPVTQVQAPPSTGTCAFQVGKLCGVHALRPFGCRMFFCDATATEWQNVTYERFHSKLRTLHVELEIPYYYVEWRTALAALGLSSEPA
jgi:Fe-S-cluster containining protein